MKIQIVQDRLRSGGTERQSLLLAHSFSAEGHDVQLLTFRPGGELASQVGSLPRVVLQPFDTGLDWFAPRLHAAVQHFSPTIVLCMGRMANVWSGSIQRKLKHLNSSTPVVATMRTGKPLPRMYRHSLLDVRAVVANSEDARNLLIARYAIPAEKITVIRNALVFPDLPSAASLATRDIRADFRRTQGATDETFVLICVGMFRLEKNQRALVEIGGQLPAELDWQLWFVGDGAEFAAVKFLADQRGLTGRVKFFGFQPDPSVFYRAADVAVLTSQSESLSNFLIEAHTYGVPSVAYDVMGVAECGGRSVPLGDIKAFVTVLLELAAHPAQRRAEGQRLADFARSAFSAEKQATKYLQLFQKLASSPTANPNFQVGK